MKNKEQTDKNHTTTTDEVYEGIQTFKKFITERMKKYEEGDYPSFYANTISTELCRLLHDRGRNDISLLKHLKIKENVKFLDSRHDPENGISNFHFNNIHNSTIIVPQPNVSLMLCQKYVDHDAFVFRPNSLMPNKSWNQNLYVEFEKWYKGVIISYPNGEELSREDFIITLRDKRGAHFDEKIPSTIHDLNNKHLYEIYINEKQLIIQKSALDATMYQLCYEVITSLNKTEILKGL